MDRLGQLRCPQKRKSPRLTVAGVIESFAPSYWERYGSRMTLAQRKALQAILQCRTPALGGHRYGCECGHEHYAFHSCNHRLCPRCGSADTQHWVSKQLGKLLPVPYYLITFTLPAQLRPVMLGNRRAMELLMSCSARALNDLLADPVRGCRFGHSGLFGVYQSWTQDMRFHPHVHYVVPAVGLDDQWKLKFPKSPKFLLHAKPLANRLRTLLTNALREHELIPQDLFWKLVKMDWNADVDQAGNGENAVKYLGQYIRRSVISDHRIEGVEGNEVRIRIKNRDTGSFESRVLDGVEFVRRFFLHVLPDRFHRIRYRGFLHARGKARLLWIQLLLDARLQPPPESTPIQEQEILCPRCGCPMRKIKKMPRAPPPLRNEHFFYAVAP